MRRGRNASPDGLLAFLFDGPSEILERFSVVFETSGRHGGPSERQIKRKSGSLPLTLARGRHDRAVGVLRLQGASCTPG